MRTTVVLKDDLVKQAKKLSRETTLSGLLNRCLADWIANRTRRQLKLQLTAEYRSAHHRRHYPGPYLARRTSRARAK